MSGCVSDFGKSICVVKNKLQLGLLCGFDGGKNSSNCGVFFNQFFGRVSLCLTNWG